MKGKENSQTICWRIEKHGFRKGSRAGWGKDIKKFSSFQGFSQRRGEHGGFGIFRQKFVGELPFSAL
jgi:hypothetical protein